MSNELSEVEKNNIKKEVRSVVEEGIIAANNHDPDAMMKVHWYSDDYLAVFNGTIIKGWEKQYMRLFLPFIRIQEISPSQLSSKR